MWIISWLFGCNHVNVSRPMLNMQTCFDCGRKRKYHVGGGKVIVGEWRCVEPDPCAKPASVTVDESGVSQYAAVATNRL